jgi:hypothetical protein
MDINRSGDPVAKALRMQRIADQFSAVLGYPVTVLNPEDPATAGYEGFRVKTEKGFHADVLTMADEWRLALVPEGAHEPVFGTDIRYWSFEGRAALVLALAVGQAATFDGSEEWRPMGHAYAWDD